MFHNLNFFLITFIFFFVIYNSYPQTFSANEDSLPDIIFNDTIIRLKEVSIFSHRIKKFSAGTKSDKIDSNMISHYAGKTLSEILQYESNIFIKSYGPGNLAVTSIRGGNAQHTAVLWNDININNPMTGQLDLSLIPDLFPDEIEVQRGSAGALWGSGAVGGTLHLNTHNHYKPGFSVGAGAAAASFSNYTQTVNFSASKKRWNTSLKLFHSGAKNNYEIYTANDELNQEKSVTLKNAEINQSGFLNENSFQINDKQKTNFSVWYQKSGRNLPPALNEPANSAIQNDRIFRLNSSWQKSDNNISYTLRSAYFNEKMNYNDSIRNIRSSHLTHSFISEGEAKLQLAENHTGLLGINNTYIQANSSEYKISPGQNRFSFFSSYRYNTRHDKMVTVFSARKEFYTGNNSPFTWSAGGDLNVYEWMAFNALASRVFRLPALNDKYWSPGGNPELLPEEGHSYEIGCKLKWTGKRKKTELLYEPAIFTRNMKNQIIWLPSDHGWSPQNLLEVWSRGLETNTRLKVKDGKFCMKFSIQTNYIISTNEKKIAENDNSKGKQLIYVPMYSGNGSVTFEYGNITLNLQQHYTRYRYTSTDNSEYLEPYTLARLYTAYNIKLKNYRLVIFGSVDNIFNEPYQVIRNHPMPQRNYQVGFNLNLDF